MSERDVIAWFDPGLTTGVAFYDILADRFVSDQIRAGLVAGQYDYTNLMHYVDALHDVHGSRLTVGWELYVQTPRPRPGSKAEYSEQAIATIARACKAHDIPTIKGQPSSARLFRSTVVFLRRLGWYRPGQQHANDAACHLFRHMIRMKPVPEKIRRGLPPGY